LYPLFAIEQQANRQSSALSVVFVSGEQIGEEGRRGRMGYLWRVRLSSFLAGAATASAAGFFLLYKDHLVARAAIAQQVSPLPYTAPWSFVKRL
jgi:hypothetical protein